MSNPSSKNKYPKPNNLVRIPPRISKERIKHAFLSFYLMSSQDNIPFMNLTLIIVQDFSIQTSISASFEIAKKTKSQFTGLNIITLPSGNVQTLTFTAQVSQIDEIIKQICEVLKIDPKQIKVQALPNPSVPSPSHTYT